MSSSDISKANEALLECNPFSQPPFVNANNVWGKGFPDVEILNAHASDAVFKALNEVRSGLYPTASILITAQNGTGKTHIISRIRHRLQDQGGTLFIFANKFNDINEVKEGFQQLLADSLSNIGSQGVKQWQELATAMANQVFKAVNPNAGYWEAKNLVKKMESSDEDQIAKWVKKLTKGFRSIHSVKDPDIVHAIFWTLSEDEAPYAANWLAGKELAQYKANELRLPTQNQSFETVLQILSLISQYYELVICFDELDLPEVSESGLYKSQVVAGLVKELTENLRRGVILSVMMPGIWKEKIQGELPASVASKLTTYCHPIELEYLNPDTTVELVRFFLNDYYEAREIDPPCPIYPFDEGQLRAVGREKPTVREVLQWCRENILSMIQEGKQNDFESEIDKVEIAFTNELNESITNLMDENHLLGETLLHSFKFLVGETIEGVTIEEATSAVKGNRKQSDYLNFKVIGKENGNPQSIGVAVLQYDGGKALGAGFRRLLDEDGRYHLTRGCLVRSKVKPLNSYFKFTYLEPLIKQGGEFVDLRETEIKPLVAIRSIYQKRESEYNISEEEIRQFILKKGERYWLGKHNPLIREILSNPSYQIPEGLEEEPESLSEDLSEDFDAADLDSDAKDLEELVNA